MLISSFGSDLLMDLYNPTNNKQMLHSVYFLPLDFQTSVKNLHNHLHAVSLFSTHCVDIFLQGIICFSPITMFQMSVLPIHCSSECLKDMFQPQFFIINIEHKAIFSTKFYTFSLFTLLLALQVVYVLMPQKNHYTHCKDTSPTILNKSHYCFLFLKHLDLLTI